MSSGVIPRMKPASRVIRERIRSSPLRTIVTLAPRVDTHTRRGIQESSNVYDARSNTFVPEEAIARGVGDVPRGMLVFIVIARVRMDTIALLNDVNSVEYWVTVLLLLLSSLFWVEACMSLGERNIWIDQIWWPPRDNYLGLYKIFGSCLCWEQQKNSHHPPRRHHPRLMQLCERCWSSQNCLIFSTGRATVRPV